MLENILYPPSFNLVCHYITHLTSDDVDADDDDEEDDDKKDDADDADDDDDNDDDDDDDDIRVLFY